MEGRQPPRASGGLIIALIREHPNPNNTQANSAEAALARVQWLQMKYY